MEVYLMHHGIKGQRWGVRRFQNPDGTLTIAGKERYSSTKRVSDDVYTNFAKSKDLSGKVTLAKNTNDAYKEYSNSEYKFLRKLSAEKQKEYDDLKRQQDRYDEKVRSGLKEAGYDDFVSSTYYNVNSGKAVASTLLKSDFGDLTVSQITFNAKRKVTDRSDITITRETLDEARPLLKLKDDKANEISAKIVDQWYTDKDLEEWVSDGAFDSKQEARETLIKLTKEDVKSRFYENGSAPFVEKLQKEYSNWVDSQDEATKSAFRLEEAMNAWGIDLLEELKHD